MRRLLSALICVVLAFPVGAADVVWDTISTGRTRLVVSSVGELGRMGNLSNGGVNLDYVGLEQDCDTSASIYLFDGGPFVIRQDSTGHYTWGTSLYQSAGSTHGFVPLGDVPSVHFTGPNYEGFRTGTLVTPDSSIGMRATFWAPTDLEHPIPCKYSFSSLSNNFVIAKFDVFNRTVSIMHKITIGALYDWNIPSRPAIANKAHLTGYFGNCLSGYSGDSIGCIADSLRFGGAALLGWYTTQQRLADGCHFSSYFHSALVDEVDSISHYQSLGDDQLAAYLQNKSAGTGLLPVPAGVGDFYQMYVTQSDSLLKPGDTISMLFVLSSVKSGNVDSMKALRDGARSWYLENIQYPKCELGVCCRGQVGNVDNDLGETVDISDLSALIDFLYISFTPPPCLTMANCDGDPMMGVDISDLSRLIDFLYISFTPLPCCR